MPLNIFDGSAWKPFKKISIHDGSTWKDSKASYVYDGSQWKKFGAAVPKNTVAPVFTWHMGKLANLVYIYMAKSTICT
jgi:hypothetical protein